MSTSMNVRALLQQHADATTAQAQARYLKHEVQFWGLKRPQVDALWKQHHRALLSGLGQAEQQALAWSLLQSPYFEERQWGVHILRRQTAHFSASSLQKLSKIFDVVNEWASCDLMAGHVLRPIIVKHPQLKPVLAAWAKDAQIWRARAPAVAFVTLAKHGHDTDVILSICRELIKRDERFVQLGMGWVLRELWLADAQVVEGFIQQHLAQFGREGLRYAIEKMPKNQQESWILLHDKSSRSTKTKA